MLLWNYRVVHEIIDGTDVYRVHEVYYRNKALNAITKISDEPVSPFGFSTRELREDIQLFSKAFEMPIIESGP